MEMGWSKRPDCADCKKTEGGFIWVGRPLCTPCFQKARARASLERITQHLSKEEIRKALGLD